MSARRALLLLGVVAALGMACRKETDPRVPPAMAFRTGPGHTAANDTVGMSDTLLIGVIIDRTEDPLIALNVSVAYDAGGSTTVRNVPLSGEHVEVEETVVTRDQAGTERWIFSVTDRDGNVTTRDLILWVQ